MWQQLILKAMPLVVTIVLTAFLSAFLDKRTHEVATSNQLLDPPITPEAKRVHKTLDYLLTWRDLITAVITGLFVLEFSVAEKVTQLIAENHPTSSVQPLPWPIVIVISMIFLIPLFLLVAIWYLTKLNLNWMQSKIKYWVLFVCCVLPWYIFSFLLNFL